MSKKIADLNLKETDGAIATKRALNLRLVDAATKLLMVQSDLKLPSMRQIASVAGVSLGAAYRHFESQEQLFLAVLAALFEDLEKSLAFVSTGSSDPKEVIKGIAQRYVDWGVKNKGGYQLLFEATDDDAILEVGQRPGLHILDKLADLFSLAGIADSEKDSCALQLWITLHGLVSLRIHKTGMQWSNETKADVDLVVTRLLG